MFSFASGISQNDFRFRNTKQRLFFFCEKESSFQVNKWVLLKLLCTVDRGCAKLLWYTPLLTPLLCQSGAFEPQEHLGEKANRSFLKLTLAYYIYFISVYSWDNCLLCGCKWARFCDTVTEALDTEYTGRSLLDEIQCQDVFLSRLPLLKRVTCSRLFVGWALQHSVRLSKDFLCS